MTSPRPSIAIIIACYNYAGFVGKAIESALGQTEPPEQVIVVDDGSTDASRDVIAGFGTKVIPLFQQNSGPVAARVNGLALAKADIILFLDADDLLKPEALARVRDAWRPDVAKVQYNLELIDQEGHSLERRQCDFPPVYGEAEIAREFAARGTYLWPVTSGNAYAAPFVRQFLDPAGAGGTLLARLHRGEVLFDTDGVLNTLAPLFGAVINFTESLGCYRHHAQNISRHHEGDRPSSFPDFAKRIRMRRGEFQLLAETAADRGMPIPAGDLLDNELVFVNYRLMAKKIGMAYEGDGCDSVSALWRRAMTVMRETGVGAGSRRKNAIWLAGLATSPRPLARFLVELRFGRAGIKQRWRRRLGLASAQA